MDPNQSMPPSSPVQNNTGQLAGSPTMGGGQSTSPQIGIPHRTNNPNDLYAQITAADEEVVVTEKKKTAPLISFMAVFMKITFWLDEFRHSHERFFIILNTIWGLMMGVLYLSGIVTLFLSFFSFMQLPVYLEKYCKERNIQYDKLEMADYSFSKINITNLRDSNNTFNVPDIQVHSTFADFLQNRIRMVEAGGVKLTIKTDQKELSSGVDLLIGLLNTLSNPKQSGFDIDVNVIHLNNAFLYIQTQKNTIPVSFSLSGTYMNENQVVVPFSINESFLKLDASMEISGPEDNRSIKIQTTSNSSNLTLPHRPTESLAGEALIHIKNQKIDNIKLTAKLGLSYSAKDISLELNKNAQNTFDGKFSFTLRSSTGKSGEDAADFLISFKNLSFTADGILTTDAPLQVNIRRLVHNNIAIEGLETTLNGNLACKLIGATCEYTLREKATLRIRDLKFNVNSVPVTFSDTSSLALQPDKQKIMRLQMESPYLEMDATLDQFQLAGKVGTEAESALISANTTKFLLILAQQVNNSHFKMQVQGGEYLTSSLSMSQIRLQVDDYFNDMAQIKLWSELVQLGSSLFPQPFSLDLTHIGDQTALRARVINTPLSISANGYFNPFKLAFSGTIKIPPFNLDELNFDLNKLSNIFPKSITSTSGQFTALGTDMKVNGLSNISGSMDIALKDVAFKWEGTPISGINGVIKLLSLEPLITANNQRLFIQSIKSFIPLSNLFLQFNINNQSLRLSSITGQIANQDVVVSSSLIPLKNPSGILALRTSHNFDLSNLAPYINLPGIIMKKGDGSFNIPVNITESGITFDTLTFKITDGIWEKEETRPDVLDLFKDHTAYTVRSGQIVLNKNQQLRVDLDGWLLPEKEKYSYGPATVQLTNPLLKESIYQPVPEVIQNMQNKLFSN